MKGVLHLVTVTVALYFFVGCSTQSKNTEATDCVYPESSRTAAPSFICDSAIPGYPISVLRSAEPSELSVSEATQAIFDDQVSIWAAQWSANWYQDASLRSRAQRWLSEYLADKGRVIRSRESPKSYIWLVIGVPVEISQIKELLKIELSQPE